MLASACSPAAGQVTRQEARAELDFYFDEGERVRFLLDTGLNQGVDTSYSQVRNGLFFELALRPLFRRQLRNDPDVFRNRYLTFRAGYQYLASFTGPGSHESRGVIEVTGRYPLPGGFVPRDRNRGELRFVHGQDYSTRYRNRIWLERDLKLRSIEFIPYAYDEVFFDARSGAWSASRVVAGAQFPIADKWIVEPYLLRQFNYEATTRRIEAAGLKISLFF